MKNDKSNDKVYTFEAMNAVTIYFETQFTIKQQCNIITVHFIYMSSDACMWDISINLICTRIANVISCCRESFDSYHCDCPGMLFINKSTFAYEPSLPNVYA